MSRLSDRLLDAGVAVLLPQGAIPFQLRPGSPPGFAWNIPGVPLPGGSAAADTTIDDLGWIDQLVDAARSRLRMTDQPNFIAGYSGGARLASHVVVGGDHRWAAAGLVAGLRSVGGGHRRPPPTIAFHGENDVVNPYRGGTGDRWDIGVDEAGARYAAMQGCREAASEEAVAGGCRRTYVAAAGVMLTMYRLTAVGHAWPGSSEPAHLEMFGPSGGDLEATKIMAAFLLRQIAENEVGRGPIPAGGHSLATGPAWSAMVKEEELS